MSLELADNLNCLTESAEIAWKVHSQEVDNSNIPYTGLLMTDVVVVTILQTSKTSCRSYCQPNYLLFIV
jgi:hypothetical protein